MKKTVILVLIGVLLGSTIAFATAKMFSDVPSDAWYADAVTSLTDKGIIGGYPDGTFGPTKNVNRAELAVMLDSTIQYLQDGKKINPDNSVNNYSNSEHGLSFNYPDGWVIVKEDSINIGDAKQLRLELQPTTNQDVRLSIYTPLLETGYIGFTVEPGFKRTISGLTKERADLLKNNETGTIIAHNIYFKDIEDYLTSLEFQYSANNGDDFDEFLAKYYEVLDSVEFN